MRRRGLFAGVAVLATAGISVGLVACGDDDDGSDGREPGSVGVEQDGVGGGRVPAVGEVHDAVAAVEDERGQGQEFFEITVTPQAVQLYVSVDDATAVAPYLFIDGVLTPAGASEPAAGYTFSADQIDFDPTVVLTGVVDELPDATIQTFSVVGAAGDEVRYAVYAESARGGVLDVVVDADGEVLEAGPADTLQ